MIGCLCFCHVNRLCATYVSNHRLKPKKFIRIIVIVNLFPFLPCFLSLAYMGPCSPSLPHANNPTSQHARDDIFMWPLSNTLVFEIFHEKLWKFWRVLQIVIYFIMHSNYWTFTSKESIWNHLFLHTMFLNTSQLPSEPFNPQNATNHEATINFASRSLCVCVCVCV